MKTVNFKDTTASVATLSGVDSVPYRCRLVADIIRGKSLEEANRNLLLEKKKAAKIILKLLRSATANAQQKGTVDLERIFVSEVRVDEGPRIKRFMPRAQGRADTRIKRTSHIFIRLSERQKLKATAGTKKSVAEKSKKSSARGAQKGSGE
jgi:large subunit ribosomal protein L22